eukprot:m.970807 g.970807  ORF g.970807 m.970807 type:complete len:769 (-) comp23925_c0_seq18:1023-3329(-)
MGVSCELQFVSRYFSAKFDLSRPGANSRSSSFRGGNRGAVGLESEKGDGSGVPPLAETSFSILRGVGDNTLPHDGSTTPTYSAHSTSPLEMDWKEPHATGSKERISCGNTPVMLGDPGDWVNPGSASAHGFTRPATVRFTEGSPDKRLARENNPEFAPAEHWGYAAESQHSAPGSHLGSDQAQFEDGATTIRTKSLRQVNLNKEEQQNSNFALQPSHVQGRETKDDGDNDDDNTFDIEFQDIGLTLASNVTVMEGVTGMFLSGRCCAIMGPSGAGKTTIISLITGKYSKTHGTILVNGHEVSGLRAWKNEIGFVPQEDIMHRSLTVRQNIAFSARLRLPRQWSNDEIEDHIDWIIDTLELGHVQNVEIGNSKTRGISGGQRKRVNIGMELAAFPSILFLDEPTSGLDSTTATELCVVLRRLAEDHKLTVVSVIHSPTPAAFSQFHDLLLLQKGGRTAYHGETDSACDLMEVFGYAPKAVEVSPADYLLDVVSGRVHRTPTEKEYKYAEGDEEVTCADMFVAWRDNLEVNGTRDYSGVEGLDGLRKHKRRLGVLGLATHYESAFKQGSERFKGKVKFWFISIVCAIKMHLATIGQALKGSFGFAAEKEAQRREISTFATQYRLCVVRAWHQLLVRPSNLVLQVIVHIGLGFALAVALGGISFVGTSLGVTGMWACVELEFSEKFHFFEFLFNTCTFLFRRDSCSMLARMRSLWCCPHERTYPSDLKSSLLLFFRDVLHGVGAVVCPHICAGVQQGRIQLCSATTRVPLR